MKQNSVKRISPVAQFAMLLAPVVMSCFFLVYSLTGLIVEGREKLIWALEAPDVAMWTGAGIIAYSLVVLAFARWKGAVRYHVLNVSSWAHIILSVLLAASIFVTAKF